MGGLIQRFRVWRVRRRIARILADAGWPMSAAIFSGNVRIDAVRYADWYVETYFKPREQA